MPLTEKVIAIFELGAYVTIVNVLFVVIARHRTLRGQLGWIFLILFSSVRIASGTLELISISHPNNTGEAESATILQSVGLSPLLLAGLFLMKRVTDEAVNDASFGSETRGFEMNESVERLTAHEGVVDVNDQTNAPPRQEFALPNKPYAPTTPPRKSYRSGLIHLAHFPIAAATALCVLGGIYLKSNDDQRHHRGHILMEVGVGLLAGVFAGLVGLTILSGKDSHKLPRAERLIYFSVLAALPFLAVRILYSVLAVYTSLDDFSIWDPKPWFFFSMSILMEFFVSVIYCVVGIIIER